MPEFKGIKLKTNPIIYNYIISCLLFVVTEEFPVKKAHIANIKGQ
jgi:hypothetical protein